MKIKEKEKVLWDRCIDFHGHECGGVTIGFMAALYAIELLGLEKDENGGISKDEEVVCVAENDACGIDAISVILGCSVGKGNLLFHMRGKQAFSFYNRKTGKAVRLVLKNRPLGMSREEAFEYFQNADYRNIFDVSEATIKLPEKAKIFSSFDCDSCGESTGANWIRLSGDKKLCLDCYESYNRFDV
ncbi:MAG: formylmethanofuran dehydrogenase [Ruminococcaceae bacterium]|nr:formylmethanofuran dehydrogenase [Oscillospiraceae bacterium]